MASAETRSPAREGGRGDPRQDPVTMSAGDILTVPGVLTGAQCRDLIDEMDRGTSGPTNVLRAGTDHYEPSVRSSESCYPDGPARAFAEETLAAVACAEWPGARSCTLSAAHFFRYPPGGFVGPHRDRSPNNDDPREIRWRHASLVLFLNGGATVAETDRFDGGTLTIYRPQLSATHGAVGAKARGRHAGDVRTRLGPRSHSGPQRDALFHGRLADHRRRPRYKEPGCSRFMMRSISGSPSTSPPTSSQTTAPKCHRCCGAPPGDFCGRNTLFRCRALSL